MQCRLWSDSELRKDRNACANDRFYTLRKVGSTVQLDHIGTRFLHEADGRPDSAIYTFLKWTERKVTTDQSPFRAAPNGFADDDHLFQCDFQRVFVTPEVDADRVSD